MIKAAEENREADEARKANVEIKNQAETYINMINESLEQSGDQVDEAQKAEVTKLRDELQTALDNDDMDTLRAKMGELEKAFEALQHASGQTGESHDSTGNDDGPIDADFTEDK